MPIDGCGRTPRMQGSIQPPAIASALWRRLDLPGHDAARLSRTADGYVIEGLTVFRHPEGPAALGYQVTLAANWSTLEAHVAGFTGARRIEHRIIRVSAGWILDGVDAGLADVADLDLAFTPATNLAQLHRIDLAIDDEAAFDVAWLDAGAATLVRLPQRYRRLSASTFDYASPHDGYRATLALAPDGFVASYPGLWTRDG
jgi:uncharacterized protein